MKFPNNSNVLTRIRCAMDGFGLKRLLVKKRERRKESGKGKGKKGEGRRVKRECRRYFCCYLTRKAYWPYLSYVLRCSREGREEKGGKRQEAGE